MYPSLTPVERVRLRLTGLGALIAATVAFFVIGAFDELLVVALAAGVGWLLGFVASVALRRWKYDKVVEHYEEDVSKRELDQRARELDVEGRSNMDKEELAEAVARSEA